MFKCKLLSSNEKSQHQKSSSASSPHTFTTPELTGAEAGAGAGVPPPETFTLNPLNMCSGTPPLNPGDIEDSDPSAIWENKSIRHAFIRKVFLILALQLLVTTSIVAVFTFFDPLRLYVIKNPIVNTMSGLFFFIISGSLACTECIRRPFSVDLIFLIVFTLTMSLYFGSLSSVFKTKTVFLFLVMMVVVCVAITVFSFQTKVDFTSRPGLFCVLCIVLLITGITTAIVLSFQYIEWLSMLYTAIGVVFFSRFLLYHTRLMVEKRIYELKPEEYLFGALTLFLITPNICGITFNKSDFIEFEERPRTPSFETNMLFSP